MGALRSTIVAAAFVAAQLASVAPAGAQDLAAAEALFDEGRKLAAEGRFAEACPKFEASHAADPSLGTLLNWADCLEKEGKLASALRRFGEAEQKLTAAGDARASVAAERRAALEGRAPRLSVASSSPAPAGLTVFVGGQPLATEAMAAGAVEILVDPGPVAVEVRRGDRVLERREGEGKEGVLGQLVLDLAAIDRAHPEAAPPPPTQPRRGEEPSAVPRVLGWTLVGTGGAALLVAGALELVAIGEDGDADDVGQCLGELCSPGGYETVQTAGDLAEAGQWVGIAGIGLLAVGITLVLTAPGEDPPAAVGAARPSAGVPAGVPVGATSRRADLRLRAGAGRLSLDGRF